MRIFCFGCSFTRWYWPTWADILAVHMKEIHNVDVYNFGHRGLSNQGIAYTIMLANEKYKFTDNDKIIVLWSTIDRFDNYKLKELNPKTSLYGFASLTAEGSKFYSNNDPYSLSDIIDCALNSAFIIDTINKAYNITYNGAWHGWDTIRSESPKHAQLTFFSLHRVAMHEHSIMRIDRSEMEEELADYDSHPTPAMHLEYLNNIILPLALKEEPVKQNNAAYTYVQEHQQLLVTEMLEGVKAGKFDWWEEQNKRGSEFIDSEEYIELYKHHDSLFFDLQQIILSNIFK